MRSSLSRPDNGRWDKRIRIAKIFTNEDSGRKTPGVFAADRAAIMAKGDINMDGGQALHGSPYVEQIEKFAHSLKQLSQPFLGLEEI